MVRYAYVVVALFLLGVMSPVWAASTFSNLPAASQPLGNTPDYVPMDQGSGCPASTPCATVQSPSLRVGQPIQTICSSIVSPFTYQPCLDTSTSPITLKYWNGSAWVEYFNLFPIAADSVLCNATGATAVPTACTTLPVDLTIPDATLTDPTITGLTSLAVSGNVTVGGTLGVTGASTLTGNTTVGGTFGVTGATTLSDTLGVTGATTLSSLAVSNNQTVGGQLNVTGNVAFGSGLTVSGLAALTTVSTSGNASIGGTLGVTGATTLASLGVSGNTALTGNATIGGTLGVTGNTTLSGTLGVVGDTTLSGALGVVGQVNFDTVLGHASGGTDVTSPGAAGNILTSNGTDWISQAPAGVSVNNTAAPYTIQSSDIGNIVGVTGPAGAITLPSPAGIVPNTNVTVCNFNANDAAHHAFQLVNFPLPSFAHLWMQQCETVAVVNGAWQVRAMPRRFVPTYTPVCYADTSGSNSNDGLVDNASTDAVADPQQCLLTWKAEFDIPYLQKNQPSILLTPGETYNQVGSAGALNLLDWPLIVFVTTNGAGTATLRNTGGDVVAYEQDFGGYFIFGFTGGNVTLDCTGAASHPCYDLFIHQQNGFDVYSNVTFVGANSLDVGVYCDSFCKGNFDGEPVFQGTFNVPVYATANNVLVVSNGLELASSTTTTLGLFTMSQNSVLLWGGTLVLGSSVTINGKTIFVTNNSEALLSSSFSVSGSASGAALSYAALNGGILCNGSSTSVPGPGGGGITSASGWTDGGAVATGGACIP